jgi:hypothetical protein
MVVCCTAGAAEAHKTNAHNNRTAISGKTETKPYYMYMSTHTDLELPSRF